jgi:hypothetical protein
MVKQSIRLVALAAGTAVLGSGGCVRQVVDLSKANDSYQCQYMKDVCREESEYEAKYAKMTGEEKKEMKSILDTYRSQCGSAIRACDESTSRKK